MHKRGNRNLDTLRSRYPLFTSRNLKQYLSSWTVNQSFWWDYSCYLPNDQEEFFETLSMLSNSPSVHMTAQHFRLLCLKEKTQHFSKHFNVMLCIFILLLDICTFSAKFYSTLFSDNVSISVFLCVFVQWWHWTARSSRFTDGSEVSARRHRYGDNSGWILLLVGSQERWL